MPYDRNAFITRNAIEGVAFDYMTSATDFIADALFTPKVVDNSRKKIYQRDTSKLRYVDTRKGTNAEPQLVDEQLFTSDITLEEHKLGKEINPRDVRDADMPSLLDQSRAAQQVTNHLLIYREKAAADLVTTAANYPSALTSALAGGARWNDPAGDPEADRVTINAALRNACGGEANAVAMGIETFDKLTLSANFRDRTKYTGSGPVTDAMIKAYFKVDYFFIGRARYDSANEGAAASIGGFWGTNAIFYRYNPSVGLEDTSFGHMYYMQSPFWSDVYVDMKRKGSAGAMTRVTVGTEYKLGPGFIESASSSKFSAGYLLRTVVN